MTQLQTIRNLIAYLPPKEIVYADKFFRNRDFQSLYEIVESTIIKIKNSLASQKPKEEYRNIDMDSLEFLLASVIEYKEQLEYVGDTDESITDEYYE